MPREKSMKDLPKGIEDLPEHAKEIYRKAHNNAFEQYKDSMKRGGRATLEEVAHKVAWAAVKKQYEEKTGKSITEASSVNVRERDKIKSILTEKVYEVKTIKDWVVVLQSLDGSSQVWTERGNLKIFYEKAENGENLEDSARTPAKPKPLRSPAYVTLE